MKLYHFPPSPNSRRVRLTAIQLGIELDEQIIDLTAGEQRTDEYLALNPNGMIPTLVDGDFVLWESNAIAQYLASKVPGNSLYPDCPKGRADISRWQCWQLAHWGPACDAFIAERVVKPILGQGEPDLARLEKAAAEMARFGAVLDGHLARREWLVGDGLTLADFSVAAPLGLAQAAGMPIAGFANIRRWLDALAELPAWRQTEPEPPAPRQ